MLQIDGSIGEGGGQVLRTALSLSCVLQKPVLVKNIRAGRPKPGLAAQHLAVCGLLAQISGAKMEGASLGSTTLEFSPGEISGGNYKFDIGTAGSCTLFLQAALPVLARAQQPSTLQITGGTHVSHSPTYEYFSEVFLPAARKLGLRAQARMLRAGFYPRGGGMVELAVEPSEFIGCALAPIRHPTRYSILSSMLPAHVLAREEEEVKRAFPDAAGEAREVAASCAGNAVTVWGGPFGASSLGERGKPAQQVAQEACGGLASEMASGCAVDARLADQLLVYAALAQGKTEFSTPHFSSHLKTNAEAIREMTGRNIILARECSIEVV